MWASLLKGKDAVIQEVAEEMGRRDPSASKTRVALTDGERALQIRVDRKLKITLILDWIHALEKLWKAAYVFHAEASLDADLWVMHRTLRILEGNVGQVVKGLRQKVSPNAASREPKRKRWRESPITSTGTAPACAMTNTSPTAGRSPVVPSRARART